MIIDHDIRYQSRLRRQHRYGNLPCDLPLIIGEEGRAYQQPLPQNLALWPLGHFHIDGKPSGPDLDLGLIRAANS
jgi:hypothetical protein